MKNITLIFSILFMSFIMGSRAYAQETLQTKSFKVFGACEMCKERIEHVLKIKGIRSANWNVNTKIMDIVFDSSLVTLEKIENKILAAGHDLEKRKAKDVVYNNLPACCHYREEEENQKHLIPGELVKGVVLQDNLQGKFDALALASIYWAGSSEGVLSDSTGVFSIPRSSATDKLVVSYIGYKPDTITVLDTKDLKVILASKNQLSQITVTARQGSFISYANAIRTQVMTNTELLKAACCNLSESFETNPSVDVSYNDAMTGSKQIQLLGLSGNYSQLTVENLPGPRGLGTALGLNSIAGPWIESIQLTKGTGSVANGFESIAGQINVELKKPETAEKLLANVYVNQFGKTDLNLNLTQKLSNKWSTALLLHEDFLHNRNIDMNKDGFLDMPNGQQFGMVNRFKYDDSKGILAQFGIKLFSDEKSGGQTNFNPKTDINSTSTYGIGIQTNRNELFGKFGYVFPQAKYKSIGLQLSSTQFSNNSFFGRTNYDGKQETGYANLIYQSIIGSTIHKYRTGLSFNYDHYNELLNQNTYTRTEKVIGAFAEYTFTPTETFSMIIGLRGDNNSLYGAFATPRINLRYEPIKGSVFRISVGRGQRTANIFAENNSVFASSRQVTIVSGYNTKAYGLDQEIAWNKGISFDQKMNLFGRNAGLSFDFFRNDFQQQVVVDLESPMQVKFYNLAGRSFSNSFQSEFNMEPFNKTELRLAYRYFDVKNTINGTLLDRALISKHRAFLSIDHETTHSWKFNITLSYLGKKRIPYTSSNPAPFQLKPYSPSYFLMNAQVTKKMGKKYPMDLYLGAENLTNYYQSKSILSAEQPFSPYFDASLIWGPLYGRMVYLGWRLKIK